MKYEYKILETEEPKAPAEQLTEFGNDGWLLQVVYPYEGNWYYIFVRAVAN